MLTRSWARALACYAFTYVEMYTAVVSTALISNGTSGERFVFLTTWRTERLRDEIISYVRTCNIHVSVYFVSFLHLDAINQSCADRRAISYRQRVFLRTASRVLLIQSWPMSTIGRVCVFCVIRRAHSLPWILLTTSISKCFLGSSAAQRLLWAGNGLRSYRHAGESLLNVQND